MDCAGGKIELGGSWGRVVAFGGGRGGGNEREGEGGRGREREGEKERNRTNTADTRDSNRGKPRDCVTICHTGYIPPVCSTRWCPKITSSRKGIALASLGKVYEPRYGIRLGSTMRRSSTTTAERMHSLHCIGGRQRTGEWGWEKGKSGSQCCVLWSVVWSDCRGLSGWWGGRDWLEMCLR